MMWLTMNVMCLQTPLGGIHLHETRKKFLEGSLHPANVLMCPHTCVTNLPKPREHRPDRDVTPSAVHVGNIVQGARLAWAQGRELSMTEEDGDGTKKVGILDSVTRKYSITCIQRPLKGSSESCLFKCRFY